MPRSRRPTKGSAKFAPPPPPDAIGKPRPPVKGEVSDLSLHQLFEQQARTMLDRLDLDEEQKQSILVAMSCPCCGAGGMSFTAKLRRKKT